MMENNQKINRSNRVLHYGLRKLSIGLVSVCLGATVALLGNQATAQADELPDSSVLSTATNSAAPAGRQNSAVLVETETAKPSAIDTSAVSATATGQDDQNTVTTADDTDTSDSDAGQDEPENRFQPVPIRTSVGRVPDPKAAFANWSISQNNISGYDPDALSAAWQGARRV